MIKKLFDIFTKRNHSNRVCGKIWAYCSGLLKRYRGNSWKKISGNDVQCKVANAIKDSSLHQTIPFGKILLENVLEPSGYILFSDLESKRIVLLRHYNHTQYPVKEEMMVRIVFDVLTLMQLLTEDNSIYSITPSYDCDLLLYSKATDCWKSEGNVYKINDTQSLIKEDDKWKIKTGNELLFQECFSFENEIYDQLYPLLGKLIYPTEKLENYIAHNYRSQQAYETQRSLGIARWANVIALGIGVCSLGVAPYINTTISTNKGKTTLVEYQFDSLLTTKHEIMLIRDTIILHQPDTVRCVIIEDKTRQNIKNK